jgi:hypothetical protein
LQGVESGGQGRHLAHLAVAAAAAAIPHCSPSSGSAGQGEQSCRPAGQPPTNGRLSLTPCYSPVQCASCPQCESESENERWAGPGEAKVGSQER